MEVNIETQDVDLNTLSLPEKLVHKLWKARKLGLEELATIIKNSDANDDTCLSKYKDILSKLPSDTNVLVSEAALKTILVYIERWKICTRFREHVLPQIIVKCLSSTRTSLNTISLEVILSYIEYSSSASFVLEKLSEALTHKTPRVVATALSAINSSLKAYGSKVINLKYVLKNTVKCFEHKDKQVRREAVSLIVEIYRWDRNIVEDIYSNLKPVQIKELKELFSRVTQEKPVPTRVLKHDRSNIGPSALDGTRNDESDEEISDTHEQKDPYLVAKMVSVARHPDLIPSLELLDNTDWKLRKEGLDKLLEIFSVMRIEPDNLWIVVKKLVKKITDSNINVCAATIECLCALCLGLRSNFATYKSHVISAAIEKLKEKKKIVLDQLRQLLDSIFLVSGEFSSIMFNLEEGAMHKNPQVRAEVVLWIVRSAKVYRGRLEKQIVTQLLDIALKAIADSDKVVREYAAELIACLQKLSSNSTLIKTLSTKLEKQKIIRITEYIGTIELNKPTIYENEEYLLSRGVAVVLTKKCSNTAVETDKSDDRDSKPLKTSEYRELEAEKLDVENKESNDMEMDSKSSSKSRLSSDVEITQDNFCDARENMPLPIILGCTKAEKQQRISKPLDTDVIVRRDLREVLLVNAKGVLSTEVYSLISNINNETEMNIIQMLEKILQPISQIPESLAYAASHMNIDQDELERRYINSSDVLFLLSICLFSTKTYSITMRCLLLIQTMLCLIDDKNCSLSDFEAKALSFTLLSCVNCENNDMDTMVSALFRKLARIFPASIIIGYTCEVLDQCPNSRRLCLEEITHLVRRSTTGCYYPEKIVPLAASLLTSQDPQIRERAGILLNVIHTKIQGSIYNFLKNVPSSVLQLTKNLFPKDELSNTSPKDNLHPKSSPIPSPTSFVSDNKQTKMSEKLIKRTSPNKNRKSTSAMSPLLYYQNSGSVTKENFSDVSPVIQSIIARLTLRDHLHKIAALKELEKIMSDEYSDAITSSCIRILTSNLLCELKYAVSYILNDENTIGRLCKHLINALAKIFCCSTVRSLDENTLKHTFIGMLDLLLELSFIDAEPCQQLSKVLNVLIIRILDNADRTQSFKVLITILREFLIPELQLSSEFVVKHKSIAELVMKCLWKITKNMDVLIKENKVDVAQLLLNCHQFLEAVPPIEWKRRAHKPSLFQEELPLKTVKTIMKELIKSLGEDILLYTKHIPYPDQSYAVSYIKQVLRTGK